MLRSRRPDETVAAMLPHFQALGITRLARQTGLDRTGMPCFSCVRPNASTLAISQGKGLTDDEAKVSAVMEATELAIAERPRVDSIRDSARKLRSRGQHLMIPDRLLPLGWKFPDEQCLSWVRGFGAFSGAGAWVPLSAVRLAAAETELPGICQTSNGLASGNTIEEAVVQGLCELVERDANTRWSLAPQHVRDASSIGLERFADHQVGRLHRQIQTSGLQVRVFDQTCDTGLPTYMAIVGSFGGAGRRYQLAAGYGTHPDHVLAVLRAVTEALQSKITAIASARDDLDPATFDLPFAEADTSAFGPVAARTAGDRYRRRPDGTPSDLLSTIRSGLAGAGVNEPLVVDLSGDSLPCKVVRVLSSDLEDMGANSNWRPGPRTIAALFAA